MTKPLKNLPIFQSTKLVEKLKQSSAVLFPTDTVPALGSYPEYASNLWEIKKRSLDKPLILMGSKLEDLFEFVLPHALKDAYEMANLYWPGALTMALPIAGSKFNSLNPASSTVGMRIPNLTMSRNFLLETGPLATTSANLSGQKPFLSANETSAVFPNIPMLGPIPWPKPTGMASTVILWEKIGSWKLIRKGSVVPRVGTIN